MRATLLLLAMTSLAQASAMDEVNYWRTRNGLRPFAEVKALTAAAQQKAEYRAARLLKDNHAGPSCPAGCREGTGEARAEWGWLTCLMEETGSQAGAGVAIGADGERYMVLIVRGTRGSAPRAQRQTASHSTSDSRRAARRAHPSRLMRMTWRWRLSHASRAPRVTLK